MCKETATDLTDFARWNEGENWGYSWHTYVLTAKGGNWFTMNIDLNKILEEQKNNDYLQSLPAIIEKWTFCRASKISANGDRLILKEPVKNGGFKL